MNNGERLVYMAARNRASPPNLGKGRLDGKYRTISDPKQRRLMYLRELRMATDTKQKREKRNARQRELYPLRRDKKLEKAKIRIDSIKHTPEFKARSKKYSQKWYINHKHKVYLIGMSWRDRNKDKVSARRERRRANEMGLLHPEHDKQKELILRRSALELGRSTGILHNVDHIIPLSHGGWHHHLNMQVLPASINQSKNANPIWCVIEYKSWKDVPEYLWPEKLKQTYFNILNSNLNE